MVEQGLSVPMGLEALSKSIQHDVEEVLAVVASFKEGVKNRGQRTRALIEKLEASAMEARSKVSSKDWIKHKPLEMRSKRANALIRLRSEEASISEIHEKTYETLLHLSPVGKCFRILNGNKGHSNIDEYLHQSIKTNLLSLENAETFADRVQNLSRSRFLLLTN